MKEALWYEQSEQSIQAIHSGKPNQPKRQKRKQSEKSKRTKQRYQPIQIKKFPLTVVSDERERYFIASSQPHPANQYPLHGIRWVHPVFVWPHNPLRHEWHTCPDRGSPVR